MCDDEVVDVEGPPASPRDISSSREEGDPDTDRDRSVSSSDAEIVVVSILCDVYSDDKWRLFMWMAIDSSVKNCLDGLRGEKWDYNKNNMKTSHKLTSERHPVRFCASASPDRAASGAAVHAGPDSAGSPH